MTVRCEAEGMPLGLELPWSFESFIVRGYKGSKEEEGKNGSVHLTLLCGFSCYPTVF